MSDTNIMEALRCRSILCWCVTWKSTVRDVPFNMPCWWEEKLQDSTSSKRSSYSVSGLKNVGSWTSCLGDTGRRLAERERERGWSLLDPRATQWVWMGGGGWPFWGAKCSACPALAGELAGASPRGWRAQHWTLALDRGTGIHPDWAIVWMCVSLHNCAFLSGCVCLLVQVNIHKNTCSYVPPVCVWLCLLVFSP